MDSDRVFEGEKKRPKGLFYVNYFHYYKLWSAKKSSFRSDLPYSENSCE